MRHATPEVSCTVRVSRVSRAGSGSAAVQSAAPQCSAAQRSTAAPCRKALHGGSDRRFADCRRRITDAGLRGWGLGKRARAALRYDAT
jgi:hypothetical protein